MTFNEEHAHVAAIVSALTLVRYYYGTGEELTPPAPSVDGSAPAGYAGWDFDGEESEPLSFAGDQLVEGAVLLEIFEQKNARGKLIRSAADEAWLAFKTASTDTFSFLTVERREKLMTEGFVGRRFRLAFKAVRE